MKQSYILHMCAYYEVCFIFDFCSFFVMSLQSNFRTEMFCLVQGLYYFTKLVGSCESNYGEYCLRYACILSRTLMHNTINVPLSIPGYLKRYSLVVRSNTRDDPGTVAKPLYASRISKSFLQQVHFDSMAYHIARILPFPPLTL